MPFAKGVSGNPGGAPKKKKDQRKRLIEDLLGDHAPRAAKEVAAQLDAEDPKDRQWAATTVLSYVFGKPKQQVDVGVDEASPLVAVIREMVKQK